MSGSLTNGGRACARADCLRVWAYLKSDGPRGRANIPIASTAPDITKGSGPGARARVPGPGPGRGDPDPVGGARARGPGPGARGPRSRPGRGPKARAPGPVITPLSGPITSVPQFKPKSYSSQIQFAQILPLSSRCGNLDLKIGLLVPDLSIRLRDRPFWWLPIGGLLAGGP